MVKRRVIHGAFGIARTQGPRNLRKPTICKSCGKDKHLKDNKTCWDCAGDGRISMQPWPTAVQVWS